MQPLHICIIFMYIYIYIYTYIYTIIYIIRYKNGTCNSNDTTRFEEPSNEKIFTTCKNTTRFQEPRVLITTFNNNSFN